MHLERKPSFVREITVPARSSLPGQLSSATEVRMVMYAVTVAQPLLLRP